MPGRLRFDGDIARLGTESGIRLVVGTWSVSPFGRIVDVMIEAVDGHRVLLAPDRAVAEFVAATYVFDETRVEAISCQRCGANLVIRSPSLQLRIRLGRRTAVGALLLLVPGPLRRARRGGTTLIAE